MSLKELLKNKLAKKELALVPTSFDVIGSREKAVAIIELDDRIKKRSRVIANVLMKKHKNVKTVLLKLSARSGVHRTRNYKFVAGDRNTEITHMENGCRFLLDPTKVYFSQRESTERQRIVGKVGEGETVLVFFAGVGPFAIEVARKAKPRWVTGIEINPAAAEYFKKNVRLNKVGNVEVLEGDVMDYAKSHHESADRLLMPLPEKSMEFLPAALECMKQGGVIHFYCFAKDSEATKIKRKISAAAKKLGKKVSFTETQKVLPYGPGIWKYRIDFSVA